MKQATKPFSYLAGKTLEKYGKSKSITLITNKTSYAHVVPFPSVRSVMWQSAIIRIRMENILGSVTIAKRPMSHRVSVVTVRDML
jgi:hypothetical protein